ncbi:MAG: hypothetical protein ACMG55_14060 [Microcoleus sp.]
MTTQRRQRINMYQQLSRKQIITLVVAGLLTLTLMVVAIVVSTKKDAPTPTVTSTVQIDAGLATLLDRGMTSDQLSDTKYAFTLFAKQNNKPVNSLLISTSSIRHNFNGNNNVNNFQFTVTDWGGNTINARVDAVDLSAAQLTLTDKNNKSLFTSAVINLRASGIE